jgi:hypothetical protein
LQWFEGVTRTSGDPTKIKVGWRAGKFRATLVAWVYDRSGMEKGALIGEARALEMKCLI